MTLVCKPCKDGDSPLTVTEINLFLESVPKWNLSPDSVQKLTRTFVFKGFKGAMKLVTMLADIAEEQQHHPDFCLHDYNQVTVTLFTHKIRGLHMNDFLLAQQIDAHFALLFPKLVR